MNGSPPDTISDVRRAWEKSLEWSNVYVMGTAPGFKKIGVARDVVHRLMEIQVGSPSEVRVDYVRRVPARMAYLIEKDVHRALKRYHVRGEWFNAPIGVIRVEIAKSLNKFLSVETTWPGDEKLN